MARLTSEFWVHAYLARLRQEGIPAFVTAKGDLTAGAILVKMNTLDGSATVWQRSFDLESGERVWVVLRQGSEADVDESIDKQRGFDRDLWVIEVEDRAGRHMLDAPGLE